MKRILFFSIILLLSVSCSMNDKAKVDILIEGAPDETEVILSKLNINHIIDIDTLTVKGEKVKCVIPSSKGFPDFYYIFIDDVRVASLILKGGDRVSVESDMKGNVTSISGSAESEIYNTIEQQFQNTLFRFDSLSVALSKAKEEKSSTDEARIRTEMGKEYVNYKRGAIRHIYQHPKSFTSIPLLYRRISENLPVFGELNDALIFKMVYDSLRPLYPSSPYIVSLADEVDRRQSEMALNIKLQNAKVTSFPEISLYDTNAQMRNLSDYEGNVIILLFWTTIQPEQKIFTLELKSLYEKYHNKGLEVFQISCDPDKTAWARTVKEQALPWVSLHDPLGNNSQYLSLYNVKRLPTMYIIEKDGTISSERDVFNINRLDKILEKLVR